MKTWITSDLHFGHERIIKFCPKTRGHYIDVNHMNQDMILQWNNKVSKNDITYLVGDISYLSNKKSVEVLTSLNGEKILIEGNHDQKLLKDPAFRNCFVEIHKYLEITYDNTFIVMCHYPIFDHNRASYGSIMLHGHRHGNPHSIPGRIMDVGFDATGNIVTDLDEVIKKLQSIPYMHHH